MTSNFPRLGWLMMAAALSLAARTAGAHQVWLEAEADGVRLYFGEFGDNQREASPGYLDKLVAPEAKRLSPRAAPAALVAEKLPTAIRFKSGAVKAGHSVIALDPAYPLIESRQGERPQRTAWTPAARYVSKLQPEPAQLTLDIVPAAEPGTFQIYFRGAPLSGAEATLVAASGWSRSGKTDAAGKVAFTLPWKGLYALLVRHTDPTAGKRTNAKGQEEAYDVASFATTLTFVTEAGLPSPPRPPVAPPNPLPTPSESGKPSRGS